MKSVQMKFYWSFLIGLVFSSILIADPYPDQHYILQGADSLLKDAVEVNNIVIANDSLSLVLTDSSMSGYIILREQASASPFNRGLPSWNGQVTNDYSAFKIQMRFPAGDSWSPWLTVGFWEEHIWNNYGSTGYSGGFIDYDYVKLYTYQSRWQFKVVMKRYALDHASPRLHKLSFFVSDTRTTEQMDYTAILNDKPEEILIPTTFLYQYALDPNIGGSICSPTSVAMILLSYGIEVDAVEFARDTRDPHYGFFGVWPRVVQNAAEYGLDGAVTRYRSWSQAHQTLASGGRIAMSVGPPLYSGHLMMLAGFTDGGYPIVHDPAKSNGYGYIFNKSDLSHSWFDKGGIGYTFYLRDSSMVTRLSPEENSVASVPGNHELLRNYPNPFNGRTTLAFQVPAREKVQLTIFNIRGEMVSQLLNTELAAGGYHIIWDGTDQNAETVSAGIYFAILRVGSKEDQTRLVFLK